MKEKIRGSLPDLLAILTGNLFLALTVVLFILPGELISHGPFPVGKGIVGHSGVRFCFGI